MQIRSRSLRRIDSTASNLIAKSREVVFSYTGIAGPHIPIIPFLRTLARRLLAETDKARLNGGGQHDKNLLRRPAYPGAHCQTFADVSIPDVTAYLARGQTFPKDTGEPCICEVMC